MILLSLSRRDGTTAFPLEIASRFSSRVWIFASCFVPSQKNDRWMAGTSMRAPVGLL